MAASGHGAALHRAFSIALAHAGEPLERWVSLRCNGGLSAIDLGMGLQYNLRSTGSYSKHTKWLNNAFNAASPLSLLPT
jgi:hypothetical protein